MLPFSPSCLLFNGCVPRWVAQSVQRLGYVLDNRRIVVSFPVGAIDVDRLRNVQTASGAHPASYSMGTGALSRRQIGRGVNCLPTSVWCQG